MSSPTTQVGVRPEFAVRRRIYRLQVGLGRPFRDTFRSMLIGFGAGVAAALVAAGMSHSPVVADREDPIPILATARREIGEVDSSMRFERLVAKWALIGAAAIVSAAFMAAAIS